MTVVALGRDSRRLPVAPAGLTGWLAVLAFVALCLALRDRLPWLAAFPPAWTPPLAAWLNTITDVVFSSLQPITRAAAGGIDVLIRALRSILQWLPWYSLTAVAVLVSLRASGWRLAAFAASTCAYILAAGYWQQTVNTLVLVLLAIPLSVLLGFLIGILAQRVAATRVAIEGCLDVMQTMPAFAYLIPLLLLFGFGPVVGLTASAVFAIPPMVRNTWLGLDLVPTEIKEAAEMSGCSPLQRLLFAEIPSALPQLLVGINQTTMAALSMVIVATIVGGFEDIGWEVLSATRVAQLGHSLLAGLVIALLAILFDRTTKGFVRRAQSDRSRAAPVHRILVAFLWLMVMAGVLMRLFLPDSPVLLLGEHGYIPVEALDRWFLALVADHAAAITAVKNAILTYFLLPIRVGLATAVVPELWGFGLTPGLVLAYSLVVLSATVGATRMIGWKGGVFAIIAGLLLFYGVATFPWPAIFLLIVALAWSAGRIHVAVFCLLSLSLILLAGLWAPMMLSIYLCGLAVLVSLLIGGIAGTWAASSDRVSAVVTPVADALQTIPQFVFLIPAVMFFKVGDVTALMAVVLYAVVPPIRYVEHGLRNVPLEIVEAARQMGCSRSQLLFLVKLPVAWPVIMLGINQTIMAALSMLAISAMVGTRDLGQQVYVALGKADPSAGLLAGLAIALLAMMSERIIRSSLGASNQGAPRAI